MSYFRASRDSAPARSGVLSVLDVGTSKVCCMIAKLKPREGGEFLKARTHQVQIVGIGHHKSAGVKSGVVIDLVKAEHAIRQAVDAAERMAGLTVDSLIVNVSAGRLASQVYSASINLGGHEADRSDVKRVLSEGSRRALQVERQVIHALPVGYVLDGERGIRDPRGMVGDVLGVDIHVLTGDTAPLRNIEHCINRAHLSVERMVATPYASGLAALVDDEAEMGAACIDMGGGTTSIAIFHEGRFVHADCVPVGGNHVTMDLARGLTTRFDDAERLKVMHGSALPSGADDRDIVTIPAIGEEDGYQQQQIPRSVMTRIIRARVEETLEMIRDRLNRSGFGSIVGKRVVLTGGASQLAGVPEAARRILGRNVRLGRPLGIAGLPEAAKSAAFATPVGLLIYPQVAGAEQSSHTAVQFRMTGTGVPFARVGQWLKESF
jgi:cell division protein FtsA